MSIQEVQAPKHKLPRLYWNETLEDWKAGKLTAQEEKDTVHCLENNGTNPLGELLFGPAKFTVMTAGENHDMDQAIHKIAPEIREHSGRLMATLTGQAKWEVLYELEAIQEFATAKTLAILRTEWYKHIRTPHRG